ncbi:coiled-coil domain-containing protein 112-like [Planococcus citri]|uniref:coiled-coil domain-containing protein 112-like n=1 Tax=Planococcus citri TaxID=170843 RepID=UPI0031F8B513
MDAEIEELCKFFLSLNKKEESSMNEEKLIILADENIFQDIRNFDNYVRKYGHTGGWDDGDHSVFVNLSRKHNLQSVIYHLRYNFPDISEEEIIEHDKWYKEYLKLKSLQQRAFKFWNIKKKENNDKSRPQTASTVSSDTSRSIKEIQKKHEDLKIKIQEWKRYKEEMKRNEERIKLAKAREAFEKAKIRKLIQEKKKKAIMEHRNEKIQIQKAMWIARLVDENKKIKLKRNIANKMLPVFRHKDEQVIGKLQDRRKRIEEKRNEQQLMYQKLATKYRKSINVRRDPTRLLHSTVEWRRKILTDDDDDNVEIFPKPSDIMNIPRLAVPNWRKNLNRDL